MEEQKSWELFGTCTSNGAHLLKAGGPVVEVDGVVGGGYRRELAAGTGSPDQGDHVKTLIIPTCTAAPPSHTKVTRLMVALLRRGPLQ